MPAAIRSRSGTGISREKRSKATRSPPFTACVNGNSEPTHSATHTACKKTAGTVSHRSAVLAWPLATKARPIAATAMRPSDRAATRFSTRSEKSPAVRLASASITVEPQLVAKPAAQTAGCHTWDNGSAKASSPWNGKDNTAAAMPPIIAAARNLPPGTGRLAASQLAKPAPPTPTKSPIASTNCAAHMAT